MVPPLLHGRGGFCFISEFTRKVMKVNKPRRKPPSSALNKLRANSSLDAKTAAKTLGKLNAVSEDARAAQLSKSKGNSSVKVSVTGSDVSLSNLHRTPRARLWNKKMPTLHCNICSFSQQCPQFKASYECAFLRFLDGHRINSSEDLLHYMKEMCEQGMRRTQLMLIGETLSGGKPTLETTEAMALTFSQMTQLLTQQAKSVSVEIGSDDSGLVGSLFGDLDGLKRRTNASLATSIAATTAAEAALEFTPSPLSEDSGISGIDADLLSAFGGSSKTESAEERQQKLQNLPEAVVKG